MEALGGARPRGGARATSSGGRVLQYHRIENREGLLSSELGQQTTGVRWLLYVLLAALFVGLAWGAYTLTSSAKRSAALVEGE